MHPETRDAIASAFSPAGAELAHELVGEALVTLIDRGYSLDAARGILRAGLDAIIEDYET